MLFPYPDPQQWRLHKLDGSIVQHNIHTVTVMQFRLISMRADFRRRLVGKTLRSICYCDIAQIRFVGKVMIIRTFS